MMQLSTSVESMFQHAVPPSGPCDRYVGIRVLWLKVIQRAIYDWITYRDSTKLLQKKVAEGAREWLFEPNEMFNSFSNICHYLNISLESVRSRARKMTKADVAKIEYLERVTSDREDPVEVQEELEVPELRMDFYGSKYSGIEIYHMSLPTPKLPYPYEDADEVV